MILYPRGVLGAKVELSRTQFLAHSRSIHAVHFGDTPWDHVTIQPVFSMPDETPEIESSRVFKMASRSGAVSGRARRRCRSVT